MPDIVTVTFSPCIDKSTSVPFLVPDKKLRCAAPKLEPGGGGINVARALKKLGADATAIYPAGSYTGRFFIELLNKESISSVIIETKNETRENIVVLDEATNQQYRFGMPGTPLDENEWQQILQVLQNMENVKFIVASGSLPPGVPVDIFARIAVIARKKNAKLIVDTSGEALKHAVDEGVFLLKPSHAELSFLAGKEFLETGEINETARRIIDSGRCEAVVVSLGSAGALLMTRSIEKHFIPPHVKRRSTVGAGDSMVAGMVFKLVQGGDLETAVQYGVASGTAATLNPGTELCRRDDVEKLFQLMRT